MFTNTKRREADEAAAELEQRVHGLRRTCADCGAVAACEPDALEFHRGVDGGELLYGVCRTCAGWRRLGDQHRRAAAVVRDVDPSSPVLDGLTVNKFADLPHAHPKRPNRRDGELRTKIGDLVRYTDGEASIEASAVHPPPPADVALDLFWCSAVGRRCA
ncbi:MAG: hypothetical protein M3Q72_13050 [Actinomycetota bacterium]|nr:hypothetical protein [Actinomycetota bacterium]